MTDWPSDSQSCALRPTSGNTRLWCAGGVRNSVKADVLGACPREPSDMPICHYGLTTVAAIRRIEGLLRCELRVASLPGPRELSRACRAEGS